MNYDMIIFSDKVNSLAAPHREVDARTQQVNALLQDVERPKGLYIYHGMYFTYKP